MSEVKFGRTGVSSKAHFIWRSPKDKVAKQRMKIIKFYEKHGKQATEEAFCAERKAISFWLTGIFTTTLKEDTCSLD